MIEDLRFERNGRKDCTDVLLAVDTNWFIEKDLFEFTWAAGQEHIAYLMATTLQHDLEETLHAIRREAYRLGVKHGKAKHRQLTEMDCGFDPKCVGW